jgi:hypothetical protein
MWMATTGQLNGADHCPACAPVIDAWTGLAASDRHGSAVGPSHDHAVPGEQLHGALGPDLDRLLADGRVHARRRGQIRGPFFFALRHAVRHRDRKALRVGDYKPTAADIGGVDRGILTDFRIGRWRIGRARTRAGPLIRAAERRERQSASEQRGRPSGGDRQAATQHSAPRSARRTHVLWVTLNLRANAALSRGEAWS